jgi:alpha/beta superfamily hydrolase
MTTTKAAHESRNIFLEGLAGRLEAILWKPVARPPLAALVCHPHPLFGGTMHNKVVYQAAKSLDALSLPVLRFNFRGAGLSGGAHDRGRGEEEDVSTALDFLAGEFPGIPLLVAGFSFGCWVGLRVGCADERVRELIGLGTPVQSCLCMARMTSTGTLRRWRRWWNHCRERSGWWWLLERIIFLWGSWTRLTGRFVVG